MDTRTEMYRSAYFNSLKQKVIDKAKSVIKINSDLKIECSELVAACTEFQNALGKEEVNAGEWASTMTSFVENYSPHADVMSEFLQVLCNTDPSKFTSE
jgi:hypothetical protein